MMFKDKSNDDFKLLLAMSNGGWTEWSPIRSVTVRGIRGVGFATIAYDYRQNWTTRSPVTNESKLCQNFSYILAIVLLRKAIVNSAKCVITTCAHDA